MPDKSNKLNIKSKGNINTDNTKNNKFTSEQLFAMISQCQDINNNKTYRTISESDIFSNERSTQNNDSNKSSNKDMSKIVKNKLQGEYGEKKFIKP